MPSASAAAANTAEADTTPRITLSDGAHAAAKILVSVVQPLPAGGVSGGAQVPAQIEFDPARLALITPRARGRLERLAAVEGDRVTAGQPVAYLSSSDFLTAQADFVQARRRAAALAETPDAEGAAAIAAAARSRLDLLGVPASVVARLEAGADPVTLLPLVAPFSGRLVGTLALAGAAVEPGTPVFRIADLSVLNAIAQVPERALVVIHEGQEASVSVPAFPDRRFPGRIVRLGSELDSATRTLKAVVRVPNPGGRLRAGMFATVQLAVPWRDRGDARGSDSVLTVPGRAVVSEGEQQYVFVAITPRTFERRAVDASPLGVPGSLAPPEDRMIVRSGLRGEERVVVNGAFTLQSELRKASFGEQE